MSPDHGEPGMADPPVPPPAWVSPWVPPARRGRPWAVLAAALVGMVVVFVEVANLPDPGPPALFDSAPPVGPFDTLPDELAPTSPVASFDNGTYVVGRDVQPGIYRAAPSSTCFWHRRNIADRRIEKQGEGGSRQVVELRLGTSVLSSGCGTWIRTDLPSLP